MMSLRLKTSGWAAGLAAMMAIGGTTAASADDHCVRVLGYEWSGEKQSMDPADMQSGDDGYHIFAVYNRLIDVDQDFQLLPELATDWSVSEDGKTWTFNLVQGVTFHDGSAFDSGDAVYTFERLMDPDNGFGARAVMSALEGATFGAPDANTFTITTVEPVATLPMVITNKFSNIVAEGATHEDLRLHGNGTGPFMQETFVPNGPTRILTANPNYWVDGQPKAPCLEITVAQEPVAAISAMKSGQVDLMLNVDPTGIPALQGDADINLLETGASNSMTISMWVDTAPFDDNRVREAMKYGVDRQAMIDSVLLGYGEVGNDNPVPPSSPDAYTSDARAYDVEKAKALLAEAGYGPDELSFDFYTAEGVPGMVNMAQTFAQMMGDIGINVNVIETPADSYWDDVWLTQPIVTSAWSRRPPASGLSVAYTQDAKWKETHWERADFDALLLSAATTIDPAERADYYNQAQQMLTEEGGVIIPMFVHQVIGVRANCEGYEPHVQNFNLNFETISCD
jgi:peptide/nickel transport system substrate-binding protein